jgi:long-chain-alcohol oxidase
MYERGGLLASEDGSVNIFAGSTLGGGTKVNWTAAIRPPDGVVAEWAKALGDDVLLADK